MRGTWILRAFVLAGLVTLVFSTHVFVAFQPLRAKVVQAPTSAIDGLVRASTAGFPQIDALRPPFALIARIKNASAVAGQYVITVDGAPVCEWRVAGDASRRVDCAVKNAWNPAMEHDVSIRGPSTAWTVEYLELATHHGNTTGIQYLFVLPASSSDYVRPSPGWILTTWLMLTGVLLVPTPRSLPHGKRWARWTGWMRPIYWMIAGAIMALLVVSQVSQWISDYRIVVSVGTFTGWLALLFSPRAWVAGRWLVQGTDLVGHRWIAVARASVVGLLVLAAYFGVVDARLRDHYKGNYSGFLLVSERAFDGNPLLNTRQDIRSSLVLREDGGYDGEFMYFAAFDPFLRAYRSTPWIYRQVVDSPPYRYGRIGFSLLALVFSAGRWQWYPVTMVWLILSSLFIAAFLLAWMAQNHGLSPALGALVILIPGFWQSLQSGLPEPIAAAALLGGILSLSLGRWLPSAGLFALSLLVRETGVVAVGCVLIAAMRAGRRREAFLVGLLAVGVVLLWRLYVAWVLFPDWGVESLLFRSGNFGWPFTGIVQLWRSIAEGHYYPGVPELSRAGLAFPALVTLGFVLTVALAVAAPTGTNVAALVYALIAICLNFPAVWVHVGNGERVTYELFVMLALGSLATGTYSPSIRAGLIAFWCGAAAYVFFGALDAAYIRAALGIPF